MIGDALKAVVLGIIEGATEFLPVSSTGHLIVASEWLGLGGERGKTFDVFIQLGAILAIVWIYRTLLRQTARAAREEARSRRFFVNLLIAFLPAAVVGFLAHDWIKTALFNSKVVAVALIVGGIVMLVIESWHPPKRVETVGDISERTAFGIGLAQVLALIPGTSRSGATIMGGYALGLSRRAATEFSFFLAIPVMFVATLFDLFKSWHALTAADVPIFAIGFAVSFVTAVVVVRGFLTYIARHSFVAFALYRIVFGMLLLILQF
jgi:undecaprenyl-diphosphatase